MKCAVGREGVFYEVFQMAADIGRVRMWDDYRAIFLGRELIYQSRILEAHSSYEYNVEELFV